MARVSACVLILLSSLTFGQPPCCLMGVSDCAAPKSADANARGPREFQCPHCGKQHPQQEMPTRKGMCNQPELKGALLGFELPVSATALAIAPDWTEIAVPPALTRTLAPSSHAPPMVGVPLALPLLL
ncbi:MAG: hypothetical protein AAGD14_19255 [Planctomycetota bacterium]